MACVDDESIPMLVVFVKVFPLQDDVLVLCSIGTFETLDLLHELACNGVILLRFKVVLTINWQEIINELVIASLDPCHPHILINLALWYN